MAENEGEALKEQEEESVEDKEDEVDKKPVTDFVKDTIDPIPLKEEDKDVEKDRDERDLHEQLPSYPVLSTDKGMLLNILRLTRFSRSSSLYEILRYKIIIIIS